MTLLLMRVSGVTLLEKKLEQTKPAYRELRGAHERLLSMVAAEPPSGRPLRARARRRGPTFAFFHYAVAGVRVRL